MSWRGWVLGRQYRNCVDFISGEYIQLHQSHAVVALPHRRVYTGGLHVVTGGAYTWLLGGLHVVLGGLHVVTWGAVGKASDELSSGIAVRQLYGLHFDGYI